MSGTNIMNGDSHVRPIVIGNVAGAMEEAPDAM